MTLTVRPTLQALTPEQMAVVHEQSLQVLERTGIRVDSAKTRRLLQQKLGAALIQDDRARFPRQLVDWAISTAPKTIDIYDRRGNFRFRLGDDRTRFGVGVTVLYYQDPLTDELTPFNRQHMETTVRLGENLPNYDVISTVGILQDMPPDRADLYASLDMLANTIKPLVLLISEDALFGKVLDMLEYIHGDLAARPFIIPYFNPVTPLILNEGTTDKMAAAIARGLPLIFSNYSLAGTTTPITPMGLLVLMNAELLAGLVVSQLMKEGAPVILGMLPAYFDMQTMVNFYDPLSILVSMAGAEMMSYYHLPHCGTSGSGTGWGPDLLAAETYWMNHICSCLGKTGLAPFVGDTLTSKAISPTTIVYAHEVITQSLRLSQGFSLEGGEDLLKEIESLGPGGNYLLAKSTRKNLRNAYYSSPFFPRWSMEKWLSEGRPAAERLLREYTLGLVHSLKAPDDYEEIMGRGEDFIKMV